MSVICSQRRVEELGILIIGLKIYSLRQNVVRETFTIKTYTNQLKFLCFVSHPAAEKQAVMDDKHLVPSFNHHQHCLV